MKTPKQSRSGGCAPMPGSASSRPTETVMAIRYAPSFQALDDFMMFSNRKHKNYPVWVEEAEKRRQELAREYLKKTLDGFPLGSGKSKLKLAVILGDMLKGILGQNAKGDAPGAIEKP